MMRHRAIEITAILVAICIPTRIGQADTFQAEWPAGIERTWIGPEYFANRLEDWRLVDGCVECIETAANLPVRTLHLLDYSIKAGPGHFETSVRIDPPEDAEDWTGETWRGFLIGAGGEHVDYRLTAMVHHKPAEDGGLLAVIDGMGNLSVRDFSTGAPQNAQWSVHGPLEEGDAPAMGVTSVKGSGFREAQGAPVVLRLLVRCEEDGCDMVLMAHHADTGAPLSVITAESIDPGMIDGCLALVSHRGPKGASRVYRFSNWTASGDKIVHHPDRLFGPVMCAQYTLSRGVLKMTAQMGPLGDDDNRDAQLQIRDGDTGEWRTIAESEWIDDSFTIPFRVEGWDDSRDVPYRIVYNFRCCSDTSKTYYYEGMIRAAPRDRDEFVVAAFTGHKCITGPLHWNSNGIWFPHNEIVAAIRYHDPDLLFFSGDQVYEGDLTPITWNPDERVIRDYLYKWYRWCWAFRDLARDRPCICIPDDHDVYHGNIWGAGGVTADPDPRYFNIQDRGGYKMSTRFVNAVHRTQVSHLPDPVDPEPLVNGVTVYHTRMEYAGMSFAILADRMFKSAPAVVMPDAGVENGWFQKNPNFDPPTQADVPGAELLGDRQLSFLHDWAADWSDDAWMKVVLSQTIFSNVATIPETAKSGSVLSSLSNLAPDEYPEGYKLAADCDSNGWPQTGRDKAIDAMRRGFALHIAGDQHLGTTIQYGIDDWHDGGYALCVPSIGNTWPRRWFPPEPGENRDPDKPRYTGDFLDGFGNRMTVYAVSNPHLTGHEPAALYDRATGYGIVRFNRSSRKITIEVWPRWEDPSRPDAKQYPGWPVVIDQEDNRGGEVAGFLPEFRVRGLAEPVVQVIDEETGEIIYTIRIAGDSYRPRVFTNRPHIVRIGDPDTGKMKKYGGFYPIKMAELDSRLIEVEF